MRSANVIAAGLLALAACSKEPEPTNNSATIQPAEIAPAPQAGPSASPTSEAVPSAVPTTAAVVPTPEPGEPAIPAPGAPRPTTSLAEGPFAPDSGQAAADVVQTAAALVEQGRLGQALRLWEPGTRPKQAAAAAKLARYRDIRVSVGGPGAVEGAAGSRYVAVPIHVTARLRASGHPAVGDGAVTLRRVAEVEGASAEQKRWHIARVELKAAQPRR